MVWLVWPRRPLLPLVMVVAVGLVQMVTSLPLQGGPPAPPDTAPLLPEDPPPLTACQLVCRAAGRRDCAACLPQTAPGRRLRLTAHARPSWPRRYTLRLIALLLYHPSQLPAFCRAIGYECVHPLCPCSQSSPQAGTSVTAPPATVSPNPPVKSTAAPPAKPTSVPPASPKTYPPAHFTTASPVASSPSLNTSLPTTTTTPDKDQICRILCQSGQGGSYCNCMKPPAVTRPTASSEASESCQSLCASGRGGETCSCVEDGTAGVRDAELIKSLSSDGEKTGRRGLHHSDPEPDWDLICLELCAIGDGGLLCHCDLPPVEA